MITTLWKFILRAGTFPNLLPSIRRSHRAGPFSALPLLIFLLLLGHATPAPRAASATSASYSIPHSAFDGGGGPASSASYASDGAFTSLGGLGAASLPAPGVVARIGFAGQLNDAPIASPADHTTPPGVATPILLVGSDLEGDPLTFRMVSPPQHGTLSGTPPSLAYTPGPTFADSDAFTFVASDPFAESAPATIRLFASALINRPPLFDPVPSSVATEGQPFSLQLRAVDTDTPAQQLTYALDPGAPAGAALDPGTGLFTWTPAESQGPGTYQITLRVTDNGAPPASNTAGLTIVVNELNELPIIASVDDQVVDPLTPISLQISASDTDLPAQSLGYALAPGFPAGAAIDGASGLFTWTPGPEFAGQQIEFEVLVSDNGAPPATASRTFTIRVNGTALNEPPVFANIEDRTVPENTPLAFQILASDSGVPPQTLAYTLDPGAPAGAAIDPQTGAFQWTPSEAQGPGAYPMVVRVTDDGSPPLAATGEFTVTVTERNEPPIITLIENRMIQAGLPFTLQVFATDTDLPPQSVTFALGSGTPAGAALDPLTGLFTWTPAVEFVGLQFHFEVFVTDNGAPSATASRLFSITVTPPPPPNTPPVLHAVRDHDLPAGATIAFTATASDADSPPQQLTFGLGPDAPIEASIDPLTGEFTWTTTEPGEFLVTLLVTDNGAPPLSASTTFQAIVGPPNNPPVILALPNRTIPENAPFSLPILATDSDLPPQNLAFSLDPGAPAGAAIDPVNGTFQWTPSEGQGPLTFPVTVRVTDDGAHPASARATFRITVSEVNTPPVLAPIGDQTLAAGELLAFFVEAADVDLPSQAMIFSLSQGPSGAIFDLQDGRLRFLWAPPTSTPPGTYTAEITVRDNGSPTALHSQAFRIHLLAPLLPPTLKLASTAPNELQLTLESAPGHCFRIEATTDLRTWTEFQTLETAAAGRASISIPVNPQLAGQWFRAVAILCDPAANITPLAVPKPLPQSGAPNSNRNEPQRPSLSL